MNKVWKQRILAGLLAAALILQSAAGAAARETIAGEGQENSGAGRLTAAERLTEQKEGETAGKDNRLRKQKLLSKKKVSAVSLFLAQPENINVIDLYDAASGGAVTPAAAGIKAKYKGAVPLVKGDQISKDDIEVTLTNADGDTRKLDSDEFEINPKIVDRVQNFTIVVTYKQNTVYTADITGLPVVEKTYKVTFDPNGGSIEEGGLSEITVQSGNRIGSDKLPKAALEGYEFLGWYTTREDTEDEKGSKIDATTFVNEDIACFARWKKIVLEKIEASYGSGNDTVTEGETLDLSKVKVKGIYSDKHEEKIAVEACTIGEYQIVRGKNNIPVSYTARMDDGSEKTFDTVMEVYGAMLMCHLTFKDGDTVLNKVAVPQGGLPSGVPSPSKEGYYLAGWYTEPDGGGDQFSASEQVREDQTYYAYWLSLKTESMNASYPERVPVGGTLDLSKLTVVVKLSDGTTQVVTSGYVVSDYTIKEGPNTLKVSYATSEGTLEATFTVTGVQEMVEIKFDSMGGSEVKSVTAAKGSTIQVPSTTQKGLVFSGWYSQVDGKGTKLTSSVKIMEDVTYYAYWVKREATGLSVSYTGATATGSLDVTKLKVTVSYNDGTTETLTTGYTLDQTTLKAGTNTIKVSYGTLSTTFSVWVSNGTLTQITAAYKGTGVKLGDSIRTTDITVTGIYSDGSNSIITAGYTVTGGTIKEGDNFYTITYGGKTTTLNIPYAVSYTVNYNSMGGSSIPSVKVKKGENLGQYVTNSKYIPKYSGYTFVNWCLDKEGTKVAVPTTIVTADMTLYAKWEKYYPYTLSSKTLNLKKNEQGVLSVLDLADSKVIWDSTNEYVATVDSNGVVTAREPGTAKIKAITEDGFTMTCTVTVGSEVSSIWTSFSKKTIKKGKSVKVRVKVKPSDAATKKVKFSSSNKKVATVTSKGKIKAKKKGKCTIYVKATDTSQVVKKIKITVK